MSSRQTSLELEQRMLEFLIFPPQFRLESRPVCADLQSFQTLLATF